MFTLLVDNKREARSFGNQALRSFTLDDTGFMDEGFRGNPLYSKHHCSIKFGGHSFSINVNGSF